MQQSSSLQLIGRVILLTILVLAAIWILRRFLPALAWAGVLALATWPIREWLVRKGIRTSITAMLLAFFVALLIVGPLILVAIQLAREASAFVQPARNLGEAGVGTPGPAQQGP